MKIGIMQPYFFPYLGYWQLMNEVDKYVILDDVNYIKRGWINKNFIKGNGKAQRIGINIKSVSQNKLINELSLLKDDENSLIKTIEQYYRHAPFYEDVMPIIKDIISQEESNLSLYLFYGIKKIAQYLQMNTEFFISSMIEKNNSLKGQDRIIEICKQLNGDTYINAIGGMEIYNKKGFDNEGLELIFLKMDEIEYKQLNGDFISNLSIIDVIMNNSVEDVKKMLKMFSIERN